MPKFFVRCTATAEIMERWLVEADSAESAIATTEAGNARFVEQFDSDGERDRFDYEAEEISDEEAGSHDRLARIEMAAPALLSSLDALLRQIVEMSAYDDAKRGEDPGLLADVAAARAAVAMAKGEPLPV